MNSNWMNNWEMGIANIKHGVGCKISKLAQIYCTKLEIGNYVQIDDFCVLMGKIRLYDHIHIPLYSALYGKNGITMHSFSGISPRCTVYTETDDYSGNSLMGSTTDNTVLTTKLSGDIKLKRGLKKGSVTFQQHAVIGEGTIVLAGTTIHEGAIVGAHSLVKRDIPEWEIWGGTPAKYLKDRPSKEVKYLAEIQRTIDNEKEKGWNRGNLSPTT